MLVHMKSVDVQSGLSLPSQSSRVFPSLTSLLLLDPSLLALMYFSFVVTFVWVEHPASASWEREVRENLSRIISVLRCSNLPLFDCYFEMGIGI